MKKFPLIIASLLFILSSCTIEDEFTELTSKDDILIQTHVVFKDTVTDFDITLVYYKTDGYNNLTTRHMMFSGSPNNGKEIFSQVFKEYKKVGIKIKPVENIDHITFNFFEVNWGFNPYFQVQHDPQGEFTMMYDFESNSYEIIEE